MANCFIILHIMSSDENYKCSIKRTQVFIHNRKEQLMNTYSLFVHNLTPNQ